NRTDPIDITVKVYTVAGRAIQTLETQSSGETYVRIPWDGRDRDGDLLANGVYLYKLIVKTADGSLGTEVLGKMSIIR
ncbi:MAG: FlgD immunoglobulin-like domain containing protein, partial [Bacteroidota bacterium]